MATSNWIILFENLGKYFKNENALSDVTKLFCKTHIKFQYIFLSFFFGDNPKFLDPIHLIREYPRGDSRPDFFFEIDNKEYIIEVKIYDRNQHFHQYKITFPNAQRGYIANYFLEPRDGYKIKTWANFYQKIRNEQDEIIKAYASYLKKVCHITEIEKMNLTNLKSIGDLIIIFKSIIEENLTLKLGKSKYNDSSAGKNFKVNIDNQSIDGWIGTVYELNNILVYFYCENLPRINFKNENFSDYSLIDDEPWYEDKGIYFMLNIDAFERSFANSNVSLKEQKNLIDAFLKQSIKYIYTKL